MLQPKRQIQRNTSIDTAMEEVVFEKEGVGRKWKPVTADFDVYLIIYTFK